MSEEGAFDQLKTVALSEVSAEQIKTQQDPIRLSKRNKEALSDINLINQASFRTGQPMPDTGVVTTQNQPDDSTIIYVRPNPGEVWQIVGVSVTMTNSTGTNSFYFYITDGTTNVYIGATSNGSTNVQLFPGDSEFKFPLVVSRDTYLRINSNLDNADSCLWKYAYIRLR
tara:strand:- start:53 stop:562 length:510 start_codon:yes stop_codon:yes gene_type:complete